MVIVKYQVRATNYFVGATGVGTETRSTARMGWELGEAGEEIGAGPPVCGSGSGKSQGRGT